MKEFDWDFAEENRNERVTAWLKENFDKKIHEQDFIPVMKMLNKLTRMEGKYSYLNRRQFHEKMHGGKLRKKYKYLKETFGFFKGI